ncbi:MAG: hypothetical protein QM765_07460 [Myxococcales bacterium]
MKALFLAVAGAVVVAACPSQCKQACENVGKICAAEYEASGETFSVESCTGVCEANLDGCKNMGEQEQCVLEKTACIQLQKCPGCMQ